MPVTTTGVAPGSPAKPAREQVLISAAVYLGFLTAIAGVVLRVPTLAASGILVGLIVLVLPAPERHSTLPKSRLDEFIPVWQFAEFHTVHIAAPPASVFDEIKRVRADEIFLFRTLFWIRMGGRPARKAHPDAPARTASLIDVATRGTFVYLADDAPREFVIGTVVRWPTAAREPVTPSYFQRTLPPGFVLTAANFIVTPDGSGGSIVSTETRVHANSPSARRNFAVYWRVIYPGSAIIRRMWLRAVKRRATAPLLLKVG